MEIGVIVQARMGSTRLPGKVLKIIEGKTILEHVINRLKQCKNINKIIIATTQNQNDDLIAQAAKVYNCNLFRGDEYDVLSRYYLAAKEHKLDIIIRITSDCPLIDPRIIDLMITKLLNSDNQFVTNAGSTSSNRTYPRGLDAEVFYFKDLESAYNQAISKYQREHVTPYLYENLKSVYYYKNTMDYSHYRLTLDTIEDFEVISLIYNELYNGLHDFYLDELIDLLKRKPEIFEINKNIEQKKLEKK